jgi:hypothetical protein
MTEKANRSSIGELGAVESDESAPGEPIDDR